LIALDADDALARLQEVVPDAVLVGGSAAALHAGHRDSFDHDHVLADLVERYQDVLEAVSKADAYFEEHFLAPAAKHADAHAKSAMRSSLGGVDPLFARLWGQSVIDDD
jgi:hypothetical protein